MLYLVFVRYLYDCTVTILGFGMHRRCREHRKRDTIAVRMQLWHYQSRAL